MSGRAALSYAMGALVRSAGMLFTLAVVSSAVRPPTASATLAMLVGDDDLHADRRLHGSHCARGLSTLKWLRPGHSRPASWSPIALWITEQVKAARPAETTCPSPAGFVIYDDAEEEADEWASHRTDVRETRHDVTYPQGELGFGKTAR